MKPDELIKHFWLYVLKLEQGKYYVGITSQKNPHDRVQQHFNGFYSAQWVKKYKPVDLLEMLDLGNITKSHAEDLEQRRVHWYMKQMGYQHVRGGRLNYSGKYVKLGDLFLPKSEFLDLLAILVMMGCIVGLYLYTRR